MLQFLHFMQAIPVYKFFQVSPQEAISDWDVWQPYKPWDTLHMKMDFITHYHVTYCTKPLLLNRFWNSIPSSLSQHADSAPHHRAKVNSEMCQLALHNHYNNIFTAQHIIIATNMVTEDLERIWKCPQPILRYGSNTCLEQESRKEKPQDNQFLHSNFNWDLMSTSVIFGPQSTWYEHLMISTTWYDGTNYSHLCITFHIFMKKEIFLASSFF